MSTPEEEAQDPKNLKKSAKHDSGAADLEKVTDYAEEKEMAGDVREVVSFFHLFL